MDSKKLIILISLFALIFLIGCQESKNIEIFSESLHGTNARLENHLSNINTYFYNFDLNMNFKYLITFDTLPESLINNMDEKKQNIEEELILLDNFVSVFLNAKRFIDESQLSSDDKKLLEKINTKISEYESNKYLVESCLIGIENYKTWFLLMEEKETLFIQMDLNELSLLRFIEQKNYPEAKNRITELKNIVENLKINSEKINETKIQNKNIDIYDSLIDTYNIYNEMISALENEDFDLAKQKESEFEEKYAYILVKDKSQIFYLDSELENIYSWYSENIGVCLSLFEEYYKG